MAGCWGLTEVTVMHVAKSVGERSLGLWLSVFGLLMILPLAIASGPPPSWRDLPIVLLPGVLGGVGSYVYWIALRVGKLSIVSPTVAASGGIGSVLAIVLLGERLSLTTSLAVLAIMVGLVLASVAHGGETTGAGWAVVASILLGAYFLALAAAAEQIGSMWAIASFRVVVAAALAPHGWTTDRLRPPVGIVRWVVLAAFLDTVGFIALTAALSLGPVAVVTVVASQFSTVAVVFGATVFHERLRAHQWAGVLLVIGATAALASTG